MNEKGKIKNLIYLSHHQRDVLPYGINHPDARDIVTGVIRNIFDDLCHIIDEFDIEMITLPQVGLSPMAIVLLLAKDSNKFIKGFSANMSEDYHRVRSIPVTLNLINGTTELDPLANDPEERPLYGLLGWEYDTNLLHKVSTQIWTPKTKEEDYETHEDYIRELNIKIRQLPEIMLKEDSDACLLHDGPVHHKFNHLSSLTYNGIQSYIRPFTINCIGDPENIILRCDNHGDKRFSEYFAYIKFNSGKRMNIRRICSIISKAVREDILCEDDLHMSNSPLPTSERLDFRTYLWALYFEQHPLTLYNLKQYSSVVDYPPDERPSHASIIDYFAGERAKIEEYLAKSRYRKLTRDKLEELCEKYAHLVERKNEEV